MSLKTRVIAEITQKTERDKQRRAGPSDLGDPCPRCLARKLLGVEADSFLDDFSLYPWIGTSVHAYLEENTFPDAQHELKLYVGEVDGYGPIKGTTDLYLPEPDGIVLDWKIVGLKKIKEYRSKGIPLRYRYQAQLYARGCELAGLPVHSIAVCFIPRDDGNINNMFIHEEAYQPDMAEKVLARAAVVLVAAQKDGWESLPSDDDC